MQRNALLNNGVAALVLLLVFSFLLVLLVYWSRGVALFENNPVEDYQLRFEYLLNSEATTLEQVADADFTDGQINKTPASFGEYNHWYRLTLSNVDSGRADLRLIFDNPTLDALTIYAFEQNRSEPSVQQLGDSVDNVPLAQRALPSFPVQISEGETVQLWLHLQTVGSSQLSMRLLAEDQFHQFEKRIYLLWGHFVGILIIMAAYNAVLFSGVRDTTFLYYIGYLVTVLLMMGTIHGYGYLILPVSVQLFLSHYIVAVQSAVGLATLLFARAFLRIKPDSLRPYQLYRLICGALLGLIVLAFVLPENLAARILLVMQLLIYATVAMMIGYRFRERFRWTRYYVISWLPFFAGALIGMWLFGGIIDYSFVTRHTLMFGMILEMILISMALADRMSEAERFRLYNATHDTKTGLANDYYLATKLEHLAQASELRLALVGVRLTNYEQIGSYLKEAQRVELLVSSAQWFEHCIDDYSELLTLDPQNEVRTILYNDSLLLFLVAVNNEDELSELLHRLERQRSVQNDVLPFRLSCVFVGRFLDHWDGNYQAAINSIRQSVTTAIESDQRVVIYSEANQQAGLRRLQLAQDLENALEQDGLMLYLQPQQYLDGRRQANCEVLARWSHPVMGMIPPDEFIGIAEQTGLIGSLTQWVISESFAISEKLRQALGASVQLSINISASDLSHPEFAEWVIREVVSRRVRPENFILEVTETAHNQNQAMFQHNLIKLDEAGFVLAIDDFGTGYSSLTYVSDFPFSELKIDRSLISEMVTSARQQKIIRATIDMAHGLGLVVTAEGIEDEATLNALATMHCEKIQGYYYARPMPVVDYLAWVQSRVEAL